MGKRAGDLKLKLLAGAAGLALCLLVQPAMAGDFEDFENGLTAAQTGDYQTAFKLWKPLAENGNALAQFNLGIMYNDGKGVPQDYVKAVIWYLSAAEQGVAFAQYSLGLMYLEGKGVRRDYAEASKWFRKAADQGHSDAQRNLGVMYVKGQGVPQDYVQSHMWFNLAASGGIADAGKYRDSVSKLMTPDQIAEAQRLAREWLAAHPK